MKIRAYRNLRAGTLSLQRKENGRWKVFAHPMAVRLSDAKLIVSKAGRERVLREKRKNVHAFVEGEYIWDTASWDIHPEEKPEIKYNPYKYGHFYWASNGKPCTYLPEALVCIRGVFKI